MRKKLTAIFLLPVLLSACAGGFLPAIKPTATSASTAEATANVEKSEENPICTETAGKVERFEIDSENILGAQWMSVYTPPCYDPNLTSGYPVLYVFHGQTFDDSMWFEFGAGEYLDSMIATGEARPFIIASVFDEFYYRAVRGNKFPNAVIEEIIPWVDDTFNTCAIRDCRAVGGISRGAAWAMRLGLTFPDLFSAIGMHSLPSYLGGPDQVRVWVKEYPRDKLVRIWMDSSRFDTEIKSAIGTQAVFNQEGIPHEWHLNEGKHNTEYWEAQMESYMRWYAGLWR